MTYTEAVANAPENIGRKPVIHDGLVYAKTQRGNIFVCSVEDFDLVKGHRITERKDCGYIEFYIKHKAVKLNKLIRMRICAPEMVDKLITDHKDGNVLNYQRCNLRATTQRENNANRHSKICAKSGFVGVSRVGNKYCSRISFMDKSIYIGSFESAAEAACIRDFYAKASYGEFARLNFEGAT
jgi:hypothetical protein